MKKETLRVLRADHLARVLGGDPGGVPGHEPPITGGVEVEPKNAYQSRYCNE